MLCNIVEISLPDSRSNIIKNEYLLPLQTSKFIYLILCSISNYSRTLISLIGCEQNKFHCLILYSVCVWTCAREIDRRVRGLREGGRREGVRKRTRKWDSMFMFEQFQHTMKCDNRTVMMHYNGTKSNLLCTRVNCPLYLQVACETENDSFVSHCLILHTWYLCWHHETLPIQLTVLWAKQKTTICRRFMSSTWLNMYRKWN